MMAMRAFQNAKEFTPDSGMLFRMKGGASRLYKVLSFDHVGVYFEGVFIRYENLYDWWEFANGDVCGFDEPNPTPLGSIGGTMFSEEGLKAAARVMLEHGLSSKPPIKKANLEPLQTLDGGFEYSSKESYLEGHKASGFEVGDKVRVLRKVEDREQGWQNSWVAAMDSSVGEISVIDRDCGVAGFHVEHSYCLPYFALEKVEDSRQAKVDAARDDYLSALDAWFRLSFEAKSNRRTEVLRFYFEDEATAKDADNAYDLCEDKYVALQEAENDL